MSSLGYSGGSVLVADAPAPRVGYRPGAALVSAVQGQFRSAALLSARGAAATESAGATDESEDAVDLEAAVPGRAELSAPEDRVRENLRIRLGRCFGTFGFRAQAEGLTRRVVADASGFTPEIAAALVRDLELRVGRSSPALDALRNDLYSAAALPATTIEGRWGRLAVEGPALVLQIEPSPTVAPANARESAHDMAESVILD